MKKLNIILFIKIFLLIGCSTTGTTIMLDSENSYPPTSIEDIKLYLEPPNTPYKSIAMIDGMAATDDYFTEKRTHEAALNILKKTAAEIGAHGIIIGKKGWQPYMGFKKITIDGVAIINLSTDEINQNESVQAPKANNVELELKKYKEMLDNGLITEEDCNAKKKQLLGL